MDPGKKSRFDDDYDVMVIQSWAGIDNECIVGVCIVANKPSIFVKQTA